MANIRSKKAEPFTYGKHSNPRSWFEASNALRSLKPPHLREQNPLEEQLRRIEKLLTVNSSLHRDKQK